MKLSEKLQAHIRSRIVDEVNIVTESEWFRDLVRDIAAEKQKRQDKPKLNRAEMDTDTFWLACDLCSALNVSVVSIGVSIAHVAMEGDGDREIMVDERTRELWHSGPFTDLEIAAIEGYAQRHNYDSFEGMPK